jgi:hypothetical protein
MLKYTINIYFTSLTSLNKQVNNKYRDFSTKSSEEVRYRKPSETYFDKDTKVMYGRNFGKWKCINCKNIWTSAYTWISLNFCFSNKITEKDKEGKLWFSGRGIKDKDFLIEKCKHCNDSNVKITRYNNLERSNNQDNHISHNSNLCVKCLKGDLCQIGDKKYYSTINNRHRSFSVQTSNIVNKLFINSTPENIVFTDHENQYKSVLFLPPMKSSIDTLYYISNNLDKSFDPKNYLSTLHKDVSKDILDLKRPFYELLEKLESNYYRFDFYIYIDNRLINIPETVLSSFYTFDYMDKNCLNKVWGAFGYTDIGTVNIDYDRDKITYFEKDLMISLADRIIELSENDEVDLKNAIDLSRKTLLTITKITQEECAISLPENISEQNDVKIPGLGVKWTKRCYSTLSIDKSYNINNIHKRYYTTDTDASMHMKNGLQPINIISMSKLNTKVKSSKVWLDFNIFTSMDFEEFSKQLFYSGKILPNMDYSLIVKIRKNDIFFTVGKKQEHFIYNSLNDEAFNRLFNKYTDLIYELLEEYNSVLEYDCDSVLFEFRPIKIEEKLKISNLGRVKKEYPNFDIKTTSQNLDFYGNSFIDIKGAPLDYKIVEDKLQIFNLSGVENLDKFLIEFNTKISIDESSDFFVNNSTKIYLVHRLNKPYIITVNMFDNGNVIIKRSFNMFGDPISKVKDINNKNGTFTREHRNSTTLYKDNTIISNIRDIKLTPIKNIYQSDKVGTKDWLPNSNIGTLDLETYEDEGVAKCFAIGFYSNEFKECNTFYIEENLDSTILIHKCLTEIFKQRYNKNVFYVHNLGRFDAPFIIKALIDFNQTDEGKNNPYSWNETTRDSDILKLVIKRRVNKRLVNVTLQDSAAILPNTLRNLGKHYQVETIKGIFPYSFCTKDTLFYTGKTPSINYYTDITQEEYNLIYKDVWSLKDECISYLNDDLKSLAEILVKVNRIFHLKYKIQMTESLTVSSLAMKIFLKHYYDPINKPIPLISNKVIWDDIYKAYYGGRVEVYNPLFKQADESLSSKTITHKTLYYYDVNSLYPFASLNPMPGLDCKYIENYGITQSYVDTNVTLKDLFGFFYCKIKSSSNYIGLLPKRTEQGRLIFPNGEWYGWYSTPELLFAQEQGYEIKIIKGYKFNSIKDVFLSFVNKITEMKVNASNKSERNVAKLILNSLIGRFGMNFLKNVTKLLNSKDHDLISVTRVLKNSIEIDDDIFLDTFKPGIDKEICEDFDIDYIKALNTESINEKSSTRSNNIVSIPVAAATLSYARVYMNKLIMYILKRKGKIYYTDTDSIVTDLKLPDDFIHESELGKLKLEHEIVEGYFISDKTYAFINIKGELIKKAKGVKSEFLTLDDYKEMSKLKSITNATKITSKRDYANGSVVITTKNDVKLNIEHYAKRTRTLKNDKWVGTTPLIIHETPEGNDDSQSKHSAYMNSASSYTSPSEIKSSKSGSDIDTSGRHFK